MIGKTLGQYEITGLLGKGGMGEVYRARDKKLDREVALKILPEEMARDPERLARFQREAKVLASLSHTNIAALYGLEETDGRVFLTMELAEGEDLSERQTRGAIPLDEAVPLARQIAEGLEAAHAKGIVHRDLKPANIMVSGNGRIKLLDFGLARAYQNEEASGDPSMSPTITAAMTQHGVVLGTAAYMSPEQARGKSVDRQTDIWAFGIVLFEMLTGHRLFDGETISDSIGAVLNRDPDWSLLPANTPTPVRRLLRRCLERDRHLRLRDIGDALIELDDRTDEGNSAGPTGADDTRPTRHPGRFLPWIVAAVAIAAAVASVFVGGGGREELPLRKLTILQIPDRDEGTTGLLSPDGKRVAYRQRSAHWVRDLDETTPRRVSDATGSTSWLRTWSPDSHWLAFVNDGKLWKVAMDGSSPTMICEIPNQYSAIGAVWDVQDRIFLARWRGGLLQVSANGGNIREVTQPADDLVDYHGLSLLPDGRTFFATAHLVGDSSRVDVVRDGTILRSFVVSDEFGSGEVSYAPSGHVVFTRNQGVWAVPFSLDGFEITGAPFVVDADGDSPSTSYDGALVYSRNLNQAPRQLVRVDMSGTVVGTIGDPGESISTPVLSPSARRLAYSAADKDERHVWVLDLESGATRRITQFEGRAVACSWSADGRQLLVERTTPGNWANPEDGLYLFDVDSGGAPKRIGDGRAGQLLPDGGGVLYWRFGLRGDDALEWRSLEADARPTPFADSMTRAYDPVLSPDGRFVAFLSDDTGTGEVWVARFPGGEQRFQISRDGGRSPRWSQDGRFLYFQNGERIYQIPVTGDDRSRFGAPRELFDGAKEKLAPGAGLDALPDGSGFIMVQQLPLKDAAIIYVQNWAAEFRQGR